MAFYFDSFYFGISEFRIFVLVETSIAIIVAKPFNTPLDPS
jgi:hypothetical protein